jgi:hypothetical protein
MDALFFGARGPLDLWRYQIPNANNVSNLLAIGGVPGSIQAKNEASDHKPTPLLIRMTLRSSFPSE